MLLVYRIINKVQCLLFRTILGRLFGGFGKNVSILAPAGIEGIGNIFISDNVYFSNGCLLAAVPHTGEKICRLWIGCGGSFGRNNHIYATKLIEIHENVLTGNNVYISDNSHAYENVKLAVKHQSILQKKSVSIGEGTWLGQNVCVIGASVGRGCVIGANSVVLTDIPDFSVAVGTPAKVVKHFDFTRNEWVRVH